MAPPPTNIVVRGKNGQPVQPVQVTKTTHEWRNAVGGVLKGTGIMAEFASADVPQGEFEVIVTTEGQERKTSFSAKDRSKVR